MNNNLINAKEYIGKNVMEDRGWRIGKVKDIIIDPETWRVKAFEVKLEKSAAEEYGVKKSFGGGKPNVPVKVEDVKSVGDVIMLRGPKLRFATEEELGSVVEKSKAQKIKDKL